MRTIIVTGSAGLIGSETVKRFFGAEASTKKTRDNLIANVRGYDHRDLDIRDASALTELFKGYHGKIDAIVHTASQPSHDWAARDP
jgi:CDP-paratose 2-epimerase